MYQYDTRCDIHTYMTYEYSQGGAQKETTGPCSTIDVKVKNERNRSAADCDFCANREYDVFFLVLLTVTPPLSSVVILVILLF